MNKIKQNNKSIDFPFLLGGPLYQLFVRTFLLKPPLNLYKRRIFVITLFAWCPLLILTLLEGTAFGGVKVPFLFDIDVHVRFLLSMGLFIGTEVIANDCMRIIVGQFVDREIIAPEIRPKFDKIITKVIKFSNSYIVEILLIVLIYTGGHFIWKQYAPLSASNWYVNIINEIATLTLAGYWYFFVSIPLFQFIICRWYYRMFIWYWFLWQVSRLPLQLNGLHPDRTGGLGFLRLGISAFMAGLLAHTVLLSGFIANNVFHSGQTVLEYKLEIIFILIFLLFLVTIPLLFFMIPLARAKQKALIEYGTVACDYVNDFHSKWIEQDPKKNELLGNNDIQSLADLSTSFNVSNEMRIVPFSRNTIIKIFLINALPLFPLLLTMVPFSSIIKTMIKIFL